MCVHVCVWLQLLDIMVAELGMRSFHLCTTVELYSLEDLYRIQTGEVVAKIHHLLRSMSAVLPSNEC